MPDEKMKCFLSVLYELHMMAMKPMDIKTAWLENPTRSHYDHRPHVSGSRIYTISSPILY